MTIRPIAQSIGLAGVFALGVLAMLGSNGTPQTPSAAELQIPSPGLWEDVPPAADGSFTVLPFVTSRTDGQGKIRRSRLVAQGDRAGRQCGRASGANSGGRYRT
jgi:hypothetical protein